MLWRCLWLQAGFVQRMEKRSAKGASQRFAVKQIIPPQLVPLSPAAMYTAARDDNVDMRVIIESSGVGMQYGTHAQFGIKTFSVQAKDFECIGRTLYQQRIHYS